MNNFINDPKSVGTVILAAGYSSRMKTQKPFLRFDKNRLFIDKIIIEFFDFGCSKIVISINEQISEWSDFKKKYKGFDSILFVTNQHPEFERFFSIKTGVEHLGNLNYCFIHNVDNPFIDRKLLNLIYENRIDNGYTVPNYLGKGGHPVLLGLKVIQNILEENNINSNFKDILKDYKRKNVEVDTGNIHININNQEEYDKYFHFSCL